MRSGTAQTELQRNQKKARRIAYWKQYWVMYAMLALPVAYYIIFRYMGYFGIMRNIFIPLSIPALATITLYYAVYFWNDWFNALIYLKSEQYPVMMILRNLVNSTMQMDSGNTATERSTVSIALKSAVIITSLVPIVVLYPFLSKYFVKGLTIGGVKG